MLTQRCACCRWFCHVDDDNYLNVGALLRLLSRHSHTQDVYIGRPSLERPIEATENPGTPETVASSTHLCGLSSDPHGLTRVGAQTQVRFWFATGGAGFCLSRGLALKMKPWAR